jgi:hypothetical protein
MSAPAPRTDRTWTDVTEPIARRLSLAAAFDCSFTHNPKGCAALAALLRDMAGKLDRAVEQFERLRG